MPSTFELYMQAIDHFENVERKWEHIGAGDSESRTGLQQYLRGNKNHVDFGLYEDVPEHIQRQAHHELLEACERIWQQVKKGTKRVDDHLKNVMGVYLN